MSDITFMKLAIAQAKECGSEVSPNPGVGVVLVVGTNVIGYGHTQADGGAHAEVMAFRSVAPAHRDLIPQSTLYTTLEPCSIYGRTPPCADLIVREGVRRVVVGCLDFTPGVCGRGLEILRLGGVEVKVGVCQEDCFWLHRARHVWIDANRPYVILKQAVTNNGLAGCTITRLLITSNEANVKSHALRGQVDAIVVGVNTINSDNPNLTVRHVGGPSPIRIILDLNLRANVYSTVFTDGQPTIWVIRGNIKLPKLSNNVHVMKVPTAILSSNTLSFLMQSLYNMRIGRLLVEGGPNTLQSFYDAGLWDEYWEWKSTRDATCDDGDGVPAFSPAIPKPIQLQLPEESLTVSLPPASRWTLRWL